MKVIMLQDVPKIGRKYEVKDVADGYALNFLIPAKKAKFASPEAVREVEMLKSKGEADVKAKDEQVMKDISALKDMTVNVYAKMSEEGSLFSGIGKEEIVNAIKDQKALEIAEDLIVLEKPIKEAGEHKLEIAYGDKKATFTLKIVSAEE